MHKHNVQIDMIKNKIRFKSKHCTHEKAIKKISKISKKKKMKSL